jgi:hypothetical protein
MGEGVAAPLSQVSVLNLCDALSHKGRGRSNARFACRDGYAALSRTVSGIGSGLFAEPSIDSTVMKIMS